VFKLACLSSYKSHLPRRCQYEDRLVAMKVLKARSMDNTEQLRKVSAKTVLSGIWHKVPLGLLSRSRNLEAAFT
jgi:hypothetical protein